MKAVPTSHGWDGHAMLRLQEIQDCKICYDSAAFFLFGSFGFPSYQHAKPVLMTVDQSGPNMFCDFMPHAFANFVCKHFHQGRSGTGVCPVASRNCDRNSGCRFCTIACTG